MLLPRQIRIEYLGAIYHWINHGNRREKIFRDNLAFRSLFSGPCEAGVRFRSERG
ncbi:MAG: hypothetical protein JWM99_1081 [Verrucomicrobiales bacterium]|nr:hypothetical protein [Verrucomicrobiales bacterium]